MKPAPFQYFAPHSLDEALTLLAQHGDDAKVLAGGQSLVPAMNFRLAQPALLVDLNNVPELFYMRAVDDGGLQIGAMTRQRTLEHEPIIGERAPLLQATMPYIAHVQIRNRGTLGGSLAHADPAAELPAVVVALNAQLRLQSQAGERWVAAQDFYVGLFATELTPDELLVAVRLPPTAPGTGWSFQEMARRHGDYALVGVAVTMQLDQQGICQGARIALLSVGDGPVLAEQAMTLLVGEKPSDTLIEAVAATVAGQEIDPSGDIHASARFRRHLARVLTTHALKEARQRAEDSIQ